MNPLKQERQRRHLTIDQVAEQSGISRIAVIRNEQGCYVDPSPSLCQFYFDDNTDDDGLTEIFQQYHNFQKEQRLKSYGQLLPSWLHSVALTPETQPRLINPITEWRTISQLSKAKVSTLYCIHPDIFPRLELRPHLVPHEFPKQFMQALLDAGYSEIELVVLQSHYQVWRKSKQQANV